MAGLVPAIHVFVVFYYLEEANYAAVVPAKAGTQHLI
jgi:hypothetical protein